jgi:aminomethyltransferase
MSDVTGLRRTPFHQAHADAGARLVEFCGWEMPVQYPTGIITEHLQTRRGAGLFDVSHMGRFVISGADALPFLQHVLTNNAAALEAGEAQYTIIPDERGGAIDDAYLYRFFEDDYLLVVNASNRDKDWAHFQQEAAGFADLDLRDVGDDVAMLAVQGPGSRDVLARVLQSGHLPEPMRNELSVVKASDAEVWLARTGYTGEPLCFELFTASGDAERLWGDLVAAGATPVGLGARDTLRLEAGLPLYGHELGVDEDGEEIPVFAIPLARFAVSFSSLKGEFIGRQALARQQAALKRIVKRDYSLAADLPRLVQPVALIERGVARQGSPVMKDGKQVGVVTSGTSVPYWMVEGEGLHSRITDVRGMRSIALAYMDCDVVEDDLVSVQIRGKGVHGSVVKWHLRSDAPPLARPILADHSERDTRRRDQTTALDKAVSLVGQTVDNTVWRQQQCVNLIPSEMTTSPLVRLASVMDPAFRYAEHRKAEAFYDEEIFYYQGTDFVGQVEAHLEEEMCAFLGAAETETRVVSGQMANAAVFSAMVDYLNRADPKSEPRRIGMVMNNHIGKGGHLSAQPMGALRDFVARDPQTDAPAVVNFPVLEDNPYRLDVEETKRLIERHRPELIIFGRSMVLHKEPVAEIRAFVDEAGIDSVIMYDMAHVLGLIGPHFQDPFAEGADLVTGSTHKTFFGTQRGVIGTRFVEGQERYDLWDALRRRVFPGSVSNHHLGTLLGLLFASFEMSAFKDAYQTQVVANAKAFGRALHEAGLDVQGDPSIDFTETHQVIVKVGYGCGPDVAETLQENNILCNYQSLPDEEAFTAAGGLRLGVSEMTRFGMRQADFAALAQLLAAAVLRGTDVSREVTDLRSAFLDLRYCFRPEELGPRLEELRGLL